MAFTRQEKGLERRAESLVGASRGPVRRFDAAKAQDFRGFDAELQENCKKGFDRIRGSA
jgi:hypothetical protein